MQDIKINVTERRAQALGSPVIICGNTGYTLTFTFDEEWAGLEAKTARLVYDCHGEVKYQDLVFTGDTVELPIFSNTRDVRVGVYAGDLITTTPARLQLKPSILCGSGVPDEPTEDVYNQIMELFNEKVLSGGTPVDQEFDPESENPQSGKAVAGALNGVKVDDQAVRDIVQESIIGAEEFDIEEHLSDDLAPSTSLFVGIVLDHEERLQELEGDYATALNLVGGGQ